MKDLKGTKTLENLMIAFAGESQMDMYRFRKFLKKLQLTKKSMRNFGLNWL